MEEVYEKQKNYKKKLNNRILWMILFFTSSIISSIFFKINSYNFNPLISSYFQSSIFIFFIPMSFIVNCIKKNIRFKKKNENDEYEENRNSLIKKYEDNFSEFMEKQFYEIFYFYYTSFYKFAIIIGLLFFISQILFNYNSLNSIPLFDNISTCLISILILIPKLFSRGIKLSLLNILIIFSNIVFCCFIFISYFTLLPFNYENDHKSLFFISGYLLIISILIFYLKRKINKYFYYIDINELIGYSGCFIFVFFPFFLILYNYFNVNKGEFNFPFGNNLLILIFKCFISSCISYYSFVQIMKYYSSTILSVIINIRVGIIFLIFCLFNENLGGIKHNHFYIICSILFLMLILFICKINYLKNKKKSKKKIKILNQKLIE